MYVCGYVYICFIYKSMFIHMVVHIYIYIVCVYIYMYVRSFFAKVSLLSISNLKKNA